LSHILFHINDDSYLISRLASTNPFEKEANQFANMLLLPEKHFYRVIDKRTLHLHKKEYIQELADFFHVSPESVFYSLAKKGLVQYNWKSYKPETTYPGDYPKEWNYKDLPWMYILTAFLAYQQEIVTLSRFSQLLFTDIREAQQIIKKLDDILENNTDIEH
jgi:Zn-dependent peptidase ImmA (M78 family)